MNELFLHRNDPTPAVYWPVILQILVWGIVTSLTLSCAPPVTSDSKTQEQAVSYLDLTKRPPASNYQPSSDCRNCHSYIYNQFQESMHAKSYENPLFKASFFNILLPRFEDSENLLSEVKGCIACHSPITFLQSGEGIPGSMDVNPNMSGVECDFCHNIIGVNGPLPESGNYIAKPSPIKLGPFNYKNDHHRAYAELQTKSEVCAVCHNRTNRYGLEIISTFTEWEKSQYAEKGIECQDCHMSVQGFLTAGEPVYASGSAARGALITPKEREKIYTHQFPGAHSETQIIGAIQLGIEVDDSAIKPGKEIIVYVNVDNSRSGHKLPTGTAELRILYLDLVAEVDGKIIPISANSLDKSMYDISGKGRFDEKILRNDIPKGRRVYRAICIDDKAQQTLFSFDAVEIAFDNRLQASEIRKEFYTFTVPDDVGSDFSLDAKLYYFRYPSSFAEKLGVPKVNPIELASARKEIVLNREP